MSVLTCENKTVATLHLDRPGQPRTSGIIREDQCLAVGTDPSNDICLLDDDVATTHCMIAARGGNVTVRDCFSAAGTFVDQVRIRELQLQADAIIQIGRTKITVQLNRVSSSLSPVEERRPSNPPPMPVSAPISSVRPPAPTAVSVDVQKQTHASPPTEPLLEKINQLETQLQDALAELDVLQSRLTSVPDVAFPVADPYQEEMLELLRGEILALQTALADHDHFQTVQAAADSDFDRDDQLSKPDAEKLVERLEQLLQELQQRDDQIATLTDLLEATEAANRAEQEERSQIDSWLHDIEQRCGDREKEWRAQQAKLQSELEAVAEERNRAQAALNGHSSSVKLEAAQNVMRSLRETAETQREKLNAAEQEISRLRRELEAAVQGPPREERMQLAEERSEIARLRQELEHERQRRQNPAVSDDNLKLKALRQHLNEIHEQEKKEREERKLSSRIARLWNRLDGR